MLRNLLDDAPKSYPRIPLHDLNWTLLKKNTRYE